MLVKKTYTIGRIDVKQPQNICTNKILAMQYTEHNNGL